MTGPLSPFVLVDPPVVTPYRHGLFSVAQVVDSSNFREFTAGATWPRQAAPTPENVVAPSRLCPPSLGIAQLDGAGDVEATPIRLEVAWRCRLPGVDDYETRARTGFARVEQAAVEVAAWSGAEGSRPRLADPVTPALTDAPVPIDLGVGLLEAWLASAVGGTGVIWVHRALAGLLASRVPLTIEGPRRVAPAGTPVAFVTSDGAGPAGIPPEAGVAWLYATGPVLIRRSAVTVHGLPGGLDTSTNEVTVRVRRQYLTGWDHVAAVQVTIPTT